MNVYGLKNTESLYNSQKSQYGLFATRNIVKGTILYIERGFTGLETNLQKICSLKPYIELSKQLYPRESPINDKINYNCWADEKSKELSLYFFSSKINHSCEPNIELLTLKHVVSKKVQYDIVCTFVCAISLKEINKGEELFVQYSEEAGHGNKYFNWICDCGKDTKQRLQIFRLNIKWATEMETFYKVYLDKLLKEVYDEDSFVLNNIADASIIIDCLNRDQLLDKNDIDEILRSWGRSLGVLNALRDWTIRNESHFKKSVDTLINILSLRNKKRKYMETEWHNVLLDHDEGKLVHLFEMNHECPQDITIEIVQFVEKISYAHYIDLHYRDACFEWAIQTRNKKALEEMKRLEMISEFLSEEDKLTLEVLQIEI